MNHIPLKRSNVVSSASMSRLSMLVSDFPSASTLLLPARPPVSTMESFIGKDATTTRDNNDTADVVDSLWISECLLLLADLLLRSPLMQEDFNQV